MRSMKSLLAMSALLLFTAPAKAGLLLEPYLGYVPVGMASTKAVGGAESKWILSGPVIGGRVGYTIPMFFVGVDGMMMNMKAKADLTSTTDRDATQTSLFAVAGASLPLLLRVYAGYGFMNSLLIKGNSGSGGGGDTTLTGPAFKLGASFTTIPFVNINAEYITSNFNKAKDGTVETDVPGATYSEAVSSAFMLSVSVPLDL